MPLLPVAVYGLEVPCGGMPIQAVPDFPATFRITMAAIDPNAQPQIPEELKDVPPRATLKLIREPISGDESDDDEDDSIDAIRARLGLADEDDSEDESDDDDEKNGGPSDPAKSKKARKAAAMKQIMDELEAAEDMEVDEKPKKNKGKGRATDDEESEEDSEDEDDDEMEMEEFVICTLDPQKNYQQPLDITIGENEQVYFQVTGAYDISLTGNYVIPDHTHDHDEEEDSEDEEYDLSPDEDELDDEYDSDEEEDELDGLENPRITELGSDDEEPPKLVEAKKGKNKRSAEEAESLDDLISKESANGEKLSKKQQKKLKNNEGKAIAAEAKDSPADKKKVQFAKNLEQGPTGSPLPKKEEKKDSKGALGPKNVNGVTVDDKKLGTGPAAKKGDRIGMRYIGKLQNGKVFDSNKKGKPFSFKLGTGEVIKGWDIGVAGMAVGGERRITIPAHLAYGKSALPGIPANSTLVFDIKMVSIN
ncbi:FK506-binding protein 4 [Lasiodiplodia hormozganensis]|uniref:FK506-binding protein n=1 Tax=Lasiodiplodia hormozganensis TaxID=869390 RepID=A0AA39YZ46_9PEZI|nr:FK506-binding protein 4 [Lasiodiplodia hormozganensis]